MDQFRTSTAVWTARFTDTLLEINRRRRTNVLASCRVVRSGGEQSGIRAGRWPDGEVYVTWIRLAPGPQLIMLALSMDGGRTFSAPMAVAPVTSIGFATGNFLGNFE